MNSDWGHNLITSFNDTCSSELHLNNYLEYAKCSDIDVEFPLALANIKRSLELKADNVYVQSIVLTILPKSLTVSIENDSRHIKHRVNLFLLILSGRRWCHGGEYYDEEKEFD